MSTPVMSAEEHCVVKHFNDSHSRAADGRFIVPLPRKPEPGVLGESRSSAVRRFLSLERSLHARGQFEEFSKVMSEYFEMEHAEEVPESSVNHPLPHTFYLPIHAVRKDSSTTTKLRAVFDASAKSSTGVSLNDLLLVGPTVHPSLVDVLIRFRTHRIALTTDVSRMYRAILLSESDKDLHRFVWREHKHKPLRDFRMTRITFGVSASSFIANMCVKQNAIDHAADYPLAFKAVIESFYVDDGLGGADTVQGAVRLQRELQSLFSCAGFLLWKWNSSDSMVLQHIPSELRDACATQEIHEADVYTKTLGIEWNAHGDYFRLAVGAMPHFDILTKRKLVSDVAKTFDVLGWFSPSIVPMKILLQRTWERKIDWDDPIPQDLYEVWEQWRAELRSLAGKCIPRCYYPEDTRPVSTQIHGFCDASEAAYAGVVYMYLRMTDTCNNTYTILVTSKTKVAPIRHLSIPRLELCGAYLLADLLHHVKEVLHLPSSAIYCWTDSTIVLHWLEGNPRRFKTYVGNRVSHIVGLIAPERWGHVEGLENPADCASRGLMPSELLNHELWWSGPNWLRLDPSTWPRRPKSKPDSTSEEVDELCLHTVAVQLDPVIPLDRYSTYTKLVRVTAWVIRFVLNCRAHQKVECRIASPLTVSELGKAKSYWISKVQRDHFSSEINTLKVGRQVSRSSPLKALNPFLDDSGLLRVGGREEHSKRSYDARHPLIVHAKHPVAKLLVRSEHERLLHTGPLLLATSLSFKFHIIRGRGLIRAITRNCVTCRRKSARPQPPIMGQMPPERVTPDIVFSRVGVDYAGPILIKLGAVRRPTIVKAYIAIFVSLTVKAVHLEAVSDLTADAFLACLRRFVARRGKPNLIWSDHGTNFVGANHQLAELYKFLRRRETEESITSLCSMQGIDWSFIPERAPHFGGLWEAAVKSTKRHLSRVVGSLKLTFEELCTVLSQIEACLNSRPLTSLPSDTDNIQVLTPGHFLIGRPLETLPDYPSSDRPISTLRRWELCQSMVRHFWRRWSSEYLTALQKLQKWHSPSRNMTVGDVVVLREDGMVPTRWPLARITKTHPGRDSIVRVVTVKTSSGTYTRPVHKVVLLLPHDS